jgi:TonB family protein
MKRTLILLTSTICLADSVADLSGARTAMNRGELVNAEQILTTAIQETEAKYGHNAPQLDPSLDLLSQVFLREKRYADAATAQQQRIDIWTPVVGENGVLVGRTLYHLASAERLGGDLQNAEFHSRRALAIMTAAFVDKPPAAQAASDLAEILVAENRNEDAAQMLALAEKTFETSLGPTSPLTIGIATRRAMVLKQLGRPAQVITPSTTIYKAGGAPPNQVTQPRIIKNVPPDYSEEARKIKVQGTISISLVIDATGTPTQIAILRPLGMGLDEKAIEAVSQWRFSPGTKNGIPVPVSTQIEMTFHLL